MTLSNSTRPPPLPVYLGAVCADVEGKAKVTQVLPDSPAAKAGLQAGDFLTAPLVSQIFGELLGLWAAEAWLAMGRPERFRLVELGPGEGVMMADERTRRGRSK